MVVPSQGIIIVYQVRRATIEYRLGSVNCLFYYKRHLIRGRICFNVNVVLVVEVRSLAQPINVAQCASHALVVFLRDDFMRYCA